MLAPADGWVGDRLEAAPTGAWCEENVIGGQKSIRIALEPILTAM
jgi:hypothetical protein